MMPIMALMPQTRLQTRQSQAAVAAPLSMGFASKSYKDRGKQTFDRAGRAQSSKKDIGCARRAALSSVLGRLCARHGRLLDPGAMSWKLRLVARGQSAVVKGRCRVVFPFAPNAVWCSEQSVSGLWRKGTRAHARRAAGRVTCRAWALASRHDLFDHGISGRTGVWNTTRLGEFPVILRGRQCWSGANCWSCLSCQRAADLEASCSKRGCPRPIESRTAGREG